MTASATSQLRRSPMRPATAIISLSSWPGAPRTMSSAKTCIRAPSRACWGRPTLPWRPRSCRMPSTTGRPIPSEANRAMRAPWRRGSSDSSSDISERRPALHMHIETRSIDYIPLAERHGKVWELSAVWFAGGAQLGCLSTGVVGIAGGLNLAWNTLAIMLGAALGTFFMAFHSTQGPQLGLPQMIQSRPQFGRRGALLVWGVALVNYIGYNAFSQVLAYQTMQDLLRIEPHLTLAVFTGASLIIAVLGYDSIHAVQRPISYVVILCMLMFSIGVVVLQV